MAANASEATATHANSRASRRKIRRASSCARLVTEGARVSPLGGGCISSGRHDLRCRRRGRASPYGHLRRGPVENLRGRAGQNFSVAHLILIVGQNPKFARGGLMVQDHTHVGRQRRIQSVAHRAGGMTIGAKISREKSEDEIAVGGGRDG